MKCLSSILVALVIFLSTATQGQQVMRIAGSKEAFTCKLTPLSEPVSGCKAYSFTFPSALQSAHFPHNNTVSGELYRPLYPLKTASAPAVVVYHIIGPGLFVIERAQCRNLARHGVTALFFHLPFYGPRSGGRGPEAMLQSPQLFSSCLEQAISDSRRAIDLLLQFPDVSPQKIGATGVSLGSLMTANAVATDSRITKAMMILGGGNLRQIISGNVYETQAIRQFLAGLKPQQRQQILHQIDRYDPLNCVSALKKLRSFVMLNAERDHIIPPATSRQLAAAVGNQIHWYAGVDHYTAMSQLKDMLRRQAKLFAQDVPQNWNRKIPQIPEDLALASRSARLFLDFTGAAPPRPGHAHIIQGILKVNLLGTFAIPISCRLALGPEHQFRAANAAFTAGQDAKTLWLTDNQQLLAMPLPPSDTRNIVSNSLIDGYQFKLLQTALTFLAEAPDCLQLFLTCNAKRSKDGFQTLEMLSLLQDFPASVYVTYNPKGSPKNLSFNMDKYSISLEIHQMILHKKVPDTFFSEPTGMPRRELNGKAPFHTIISKILPFILPPKQN